MGISKRGLVCPTCRQRDCSGHIGHIELGTDIVRFGAVTEAKNTLRCMCLYCSRPRWIPVPTISPKIYNSFCMRTFEEERIRCGLSSDEDLQHLEKAFL